MHELGVVFHVIDQLEEIAKENDVRKISRVTLEIGEVSTVVEEYLRDLWNWASKKHELLDGTELIVETIPAITYCAGCGKTYPTVKYGKICPMCGSEETWLQQGNEFVIKEIAVPDEEPEPEEQAGGTETEGENNGSEDRDQKQL